MLNCGIMSTLIYRFSVAQKLTSNTWTAVISLGTPSIAMLPLSKGNAELIFVRDFEYDVKATFSTLQESSSGTKKQLKRQNLR